jgi:hypothetical protein
VYCNRHDSFLFRSTWVHSGLIGSSCCSFVFVIFCVLSVFVNCCLYLCFPGLYFVLRYWTLICPFGFSIFFFLHHPINKAFCSFFCNLSSSWAIVITKKKGCYCHRQNLLQETITNKPPRCHSRSSTQWKSTPGSELWIALTKPHSLFVVDTTQYQYMRVN